jgi:hypothetical protein
MDEGMEYPEDVNGCVFCPLKCGHMFAGENKNRSLKRHITSQVRACLRE